MPRLSNFRRPTRVAPTLYLLALCIMGVLSSRRVLISIDDATGRERLTGRIPSLEEIRARGGVQPPAPGAQPHDLADSATIFVGIASYRDRRCGPTLRDAFAAARYPRRVFIGLVQQNGPHDLDCVEHMCELEASERVRLKQPPAPCEFRAQVRVTSMKSTEAAGPAVARHHQQKLIRDGDDFCLQCDAHSAFRTGWDVHLVREWLLTHNEFAVLTTYPPRIEERRHGQPYAPLGLPEAASVPHLCRTKVNGHGMFRNEQASSLFAPGHSPMLTSKWAAGFSFSKCHAERHVPNDPHLRYVWDGEEASRAARLWTNGYDFYTPSKALVYHDYSQDGTVVDMNVHRPTRDRANDRLFQLLGMPRNLPLLQHAELGRYGLGAVRTLAQYAMFSGMRFATAQANNTGICGALTWVPWLPSAAALLARRLADRAASEAAPPADPRWERALQLFDIALQQQPLNATLLTNRGLCKRLAGRNDDAVGDLTRAVGLQPDLFEARINLAVTLQLQAMQATSRNHTTLGERYRAAACGHLHDAVELDAMPLALKHPDAALMQAFHCPPRELPEELINSNDTTADSSDSTTADPLYSAIEELESDPPVLLQSRCILLTRAIVGNATSGLLKQEQARSAVAKLFTRCTESWLPERPLPVDGPSDDALDRFLHFEAELKFALQFVVLLVRVRAQPEVEFALKRSIYIAAKISKVAREHPLKAQHSSFKSVRVVQEVESVARSLLGRALLQRGLVAEAEEQLLGARHYVEFEGTSDTAGVIGVGALLAGRALPAILLTRGAVREAVRSHLQVAAIREQASDAAAASLRRKQAMLEVCRASEMTGALGLSSAVGAFVALERGPSMNAVMAEFSGPLGSDVRTARLVPIQPREGCDELRLDPDINIQPRDGAKVNIVLLLERGGCPFTQKARAANTFAASLPAVHGLSGLIVVGLIVANTDGRPAEVMSGRMEDVVGDGKHDSPSACAPENIDTETSVNIEGMADIAGMPLVASPAETQEGNEAPRATEAAVAECCKSCASLPQCTHWTIFESVCYLKKAVPGTEARRSDCHGCTSAELARSDSRSSPSGILATNMLPVLMVSSADGATLFSRGASKQLPAILHFGKGDAIRDGNLQSGAESTGAGTTDLHALTLSRARGSAARLANVSEILKFRPRKSHLDALLGNFPRQDLSSSNYSISQGIGIGFFTTLAGVLRDSSEPMCDAAMQERQDDESSGNTILAEAIARDAMLEHEMSDDAGDSLGSLWVVDDILSELGKFNATMWERPRVQQCLGFLRGSRPSAAAADLWSWNGGNRTMEQLCCPQKLAAAERIVHENDTEEEAVLDGIFTMHAKMGLFLDELGAPDASRAHFMAALSQCGANATGLVPRIALTVPIVADNVTAVTDQADRLLLDTRLLPAALKKWVSSNATTSRPPSAPEQSVEFAWTLTPPQMFHWYSGNRGLPLNSQVADFFLALYPSLAGGNASILPRARAEGPIRVGFVSSFLRTHSVGKLMRGVIVGLNRSQFNATVFAASHFFSPAQDAGAGVNAGNGSDPIASELRSIVNYVVLPKSVPQAASVVEEAQLDILVFPEIGMDAFVYFLAFRRMAPVQLFFWGHPVSPAIPTSSIDYFISSELFEPDEHLENARRVKYCGSDGACRLHDQLLEEFPTLAKSISVSEKYAEQAILMSSLTTHFAEPTGGALLATPHKTHLGFRETDHIYICPQTLMKFHPAFDIALSSILEMDPFAVVVIVYNSNQEWWRQRLEKRIMSTPRVARLTRAAQHPLEIKRRFRFFPQLPHAKFLALISAADVALDPFPWGGGVSTLDAIAAGTPVVTAPSLQTVMQLAAGMYRKMGVYFEPEAGASCCVASGIDQYVKMAINVATDDSLRRKISTELARSRIKLYNDTSALIEWEGLLTRLATNGRPRQA